MRLIAALGFRAAALRLTAWPVRIKFRPASQAIALPNHPDLNAHGKLRQARLRYAGKKPPAPPPVSRADVADTHGRSAPRQLTKVALRRWQEATGALLSRVAIREMARQFREAGREVERQQREARAAAVRQRNRSHARPQRCNP